MSVTFPKPENFTLPPLPKDGSKPSWEPFHLLSKDDRTLPSRPMETVDGVGDRLRTAAFAEIQAHYAFLWAAENFQDAPNALREDWKTLAREEEKHLGWLLYRMQEIGVDVKDRGVWDALWYSLITCKTPKDFAVFMASAEERGRRAGERFAQALHRFDPHSARIFGQIAREEVSHIELATRYFPNETQARVERNNIAYGA